jgi:hypothetical protein
MGANTSDRATAQGAGRATRHFRGLAVLLPEFAVNQWLTHI